MIYKLEKEIYLYKIFISVKGAQPRDAGRWSCEVGSKIRSQWALAGEIHIEVQQGGETSDPLTSVIQANTTLLVICVVVFVVFMTILLCVVLMYGRTRLSQTPHTSNSPGSHQAREEILIKEEPRLPRDFIRRVLPHIIKFPIKDSQPT